MMRSSSLPFRMLFLVAASTVVLQPGCAHSGDADVELRFSADNNQLVFEFSLSNYEGESLARTVRAGIYRLIVTDETGRELPQRTINEIAIYRSTSGTPVVRVGLDTKLISRAKEVTVSGHLCISFEHYLLCAAAKKEGMQWKKIEQPAYGFLLWINPSLGEVWHTFDGRVDRKEAGVQRVFCFQMTKRGFGVKKEADVISPGPSNWVLNVVGGKNEILLTKEVRVEKEGRYMRFTVSPGKLKGNEDIWLILQSTIDDKNLVFKWRLSLNENGKWVLAEEPDYGETFRIAMGLTKPPDRVGTPAGIRK